jgi:hypothetical protein
MSNVSSSASFLYTTVGIFDLDGLSDFESTVPEDLFGADYYSEYTVTSQAKPVQEQASATFYDVAPEIQQATLTMRAMSMIDKVVDREAFSVHQIIPQVRTPPVTISHSIILNRSLASPPRAYIAILSSHTGMR